MQSNTKTFFIKPNDTGQCPTELPHSECLTLQSFATGSACRVFVGQNTSLNFLPGTYYLSSDLHINYTDTFVMRAFNTNTSIVIKHNSVASLIFKHVQVSHIKIQDCGKQIDPVEAEPATLNGTHYPAQPVILEHSAVTMINITDIQLLSITLINSTSSAITVSECGSLTASGLTISKSSNCGMCVSQTILTFEITQ